MGVSRHVYVELGVKLPFSELLGEPERKQRCFCEVAFDLKNFNHCPKCGREVAEYWRGIEGVDVDDRKAWGYELVDAGMLETREGGDDVVISFRRCGKDGSEFGEDKSGITSVDILTEKGLEAAFIHMSKTLPGDLWEKYGVKGFGMHLVQYVSY